MSLLSLTSARWTWGVLCWGDRLSAGFADVLRQWWLRRKNSKIQSSCCLVIILTTCVFMLKTRSRSLLGTCVYNFFSWERAVSFAKSISISFGLLLSLVWPKRRWFVSLVPLLSLEMFFFSILFQRSRLNDRTSTWLNSSSNFGRGKLLFARASVKDAEWTIMRLRTVSVLSDLPISAQKLSGKRLERFHKFFLKKLLVSKQCMHSKKPVKPDILKDSKSLFRELKVNFCVFSSKWMMNGVDLCCLFSLWLTVRTILMTTLKWKTILDMVDYTLFSSTTITTKVHLFCCVRDTKKMITKWSFLKEIFSKLSCEKRHPFWMQPI